MTETFRDFVRSFLDGASDSEVARRLGMQQTTYSRQLDGNMPIATVVKLCRRYSIPMLDAFVAAGFITQGEADVIGRSKGLQDATERELALETLRRVEAGTASSVLTAPVTQDIIDESARFAARGNVGGVEEADDHAGQAQAANNDRSAERLDPETT